jgi:hypothetical protein
VIVMVAPLGPGAPVDPELTLPPPPPPDGPVGDPPPPHAAIAAQANAARTDIDCGFAFTVSPRLLLSQAGEICRPCNGKGK